MQEEIRQSIERELATLGLDEVDFVVEHPAEKSHGDYSSNVALVVAKSLGKAPREVAEILKEKLSASIEVTLSDEVQGTSDPDERVVSKNTVTEEGHEATKKFAESVASIEVAGPGFINFKLSRDFFSEKIATAREAGEQWGRNNTLSGKTVLVEYTDPNPFKEFHIGHMFTNAVGESIARLFKMNGADTKRCNYQGDVGLHVACAIYGMQQLGLTPDSEINASDLGRAYATGATAYKADLSAKTLIKIINKHVYERTDSEINKLYDKGREVSLAYFETIYEVLGTQFDGYFFESEAGLKGKQIVLENPDVFPESDGARVFKGEEYGLHTRVFLNGEGLPTYEAKELALAKMKQDKFGEYDHSVVSTANEINEYFKVLLKALSFISPELAKKTEHVGHGTVRLSSGKMSSRTGDVIPALTFINEVAESAREKMGAMNGEGDEALAQDIAIAAIKYVTLKSNILQDTVFDKERALSFEGDSGPYLQYTHARICSVLEKAKSAGVKTEISMTPPNPYAVERLIYQFTEVIEEALKERAPHQVAVYLTELASEFNHFYATEKIADPEDEYAPYKACVAEAVGITLRNGLWTLGIKAPTSM